MGASLHYLGPNYRFETTFLVDGPLEDGVVRGNLFIRGSGDPSLTRYEMDYLARQLAAGGLKEIQGDIILDDSFFDDQLRGPASYDNILKKGLPIQSALSYNFNLVELRLTPSNAGSRAELHDEGYGYFDVLNRVTTATRGRPWTRVQKLRRDRVIVRGRVIQGDEEESIGSFIAPDPTQYFASAFVGKLRENNIRVPGQVIKGRVAPKDAKPLYVHRSARVVEVLGSLGKYSNNFSAEQMLKALGAHRWGAPFWEAHDPTQGMRQGNDIGTQYRSEIYTHSEGQAQAAESSLATYQERLSAAGYDPITTQVLQAPAFYYAEDYHQQYLAKNPGGYCGLGGTGVACSTGLSVE